MIDEQDSEEQVSEEQGSDQDIPLPVSENESSSSDFRVSESSGNEISPGKPDIEYKKFLDEIFKEIESLREKSLSPSKFKCFYERLVSQIHFENISGNEINENQSKITLLENGLLHYEPLKELLQILKKQKDRESEFLNF